MGGPKGFVESGMNVVDYNLTEKILRSLYYRGDIGLPFTHMELCTKSKKLFL